MSDLGLIETIRVLNGKLAFKDLHVKRLQESLHAIGVDVSLFSVEDRLLRLLKYECIEKGLKDFRLRVEIQKNRMQEYVPHIGALIWSSTISPLEQNNFQLNHKGLYLSFLPKQYKLLDTFSNLKHTDRSIYQIAAAYAKDNGYDDVIVLNENLRVADTTIYNIYMVKDGIVYTPSLSDGPVRGVFRDFLLNNTSVIKVIEVPITMNDLYTADEVFLTNAVRGLRWVEYIDDRQYTNSFIRNLFSQLEPELLTL